MRTRHEDRRLSEHTKLQWRTYSAIEKATILGLTDTGVLKVIDPKNVYLIARDGHIALKTRRARYD